MRRLRMNRSFSIVSKSKGSATATVSTLSSSLRGMTEFSRATASGTSSMMFSGMLTDVRSTYRIEWCSASARMTSSLVAYSKLTRHSPTSLLCSAAICWASASCSGLMTPRRRRTSVKSTPFAICERLASLGEKVQCFRSAAKRAPGKSRATACPCASILPNSSPFCQSPAAPFQANKTGMDRFFSYRMISGWYWCVSIKVKPRNRAMNSRPSKKTTAFSELS